jgi:hypothetical protein
MSLKIDRIFFVRIATLSLFILFSKISTTISWANIALTTNASSKRVNESRSKSFWKNVLRRSMIEKYSSKSIDDKKLISTKSNLIYWSECWLFDVLQLTSIEIYLYSTIYEMNSFHVELDSYLSRSHVVRWISRNETLRESFSKTLVLRSFAHFVTRSLRIWAWSLNQWVRLIEDLAETIEQALLDLRKTMRWLDVTYSYSKRRRNMILFLKTTVSIIRQWTHWMSFVWDSLSTDFNIIKFNRSLSKSLKIVLEKNSKSKCCQKCIKFLVENSFLKCVFDVSRFICNRCERLNAVCMTVWMSSICRWRVDD